MDYDDAFVAYINGNEVARANINGAPPAYNSGTIRSHEAQIYSGGSPERFMITDFNSILNEGENILTIQAHNQSANSSDFTIIPFLSAIVDNSTTGIEPPAILDLLPGCIDEESFTITINSTITPTFTQVDPICNGGVLGELPTESNNNITGTWAPALDNTLTTTYTFTPNASQTCAVNQTMTITVNPITPTFTQVDPICNGGVLGELPTTSNNNITGTWVPALDNTLTTTYTFTPDASQTCAVNQTMTITVNPITPTFTQVDTICNGGVLDPLPLTSDNGITGTWSPDIDNTATETYTFTPDASQTCAVNQTMTITVNPLITPTFTQVAAIFNGETLAALPTTSNNYVIGTWAPAINNTETTIYTFTPDASETCAVNETMTITVNPIPFTVTVNSEIICSSGIATMVATPSPAGFYSYTWIVPIGVDNPGNVQSFSTSVEGDYSVSISKGNYLCNTDFEDNQIVNPGNFIIVNQDSVPCWETTASDSKIEVWGDGMNGIDAYSGNQFIELNANMQSTLFQNFEIIPGSSALISFAHRGRNSSADDIMEVEIGPIGGPYTNLGSFSDGTDAWGYYSLGYVFPNDLGINYTIRFKSVQPAGSLGNFLDAISVVFPSDVSSEIATGNVSIITDIIPTFTQVDPICNGEFLAALPTISNNGVTGTWSPAIDNTATETYTFTPDITQPDQACAVNQTMTITVNQIIPTFTQVDPICNGGVLGELPTTSNNNITGTWSPAINNTATTTYTFTPDASQTCAVDQTMEITITVNPITPTFTQVDPICNGDDLGELPLTSDNGITGTWAPVINNTATETYTFTPDASQTCAVSQTMTITVNPLITPTFTQVDPICNGDDLGELPTESNNGITGTWSPAINNTATETYTFTPDITQPDQACAVNQTMTITVNQIIPTFTQVDPICNGGVLGELPTTSNNNITGTWSPAINNTATTTYTFTPDASQTCAVDQTMEITITVNPITPTFTQVDPICNGDDLGELPLTSDNGITGTWAPVINNTATETYTFTPDASQTCAVSQTMTITVNPLITPTFTQVDPICNGDDLGELPTESNNGVTGTWAPVIDNTETTTYTFSPDITQSGQACAVNETMTITVNPVITPTFTQVDPICNGDDLDPLPLTSNDGITGTWAPVINNTATETYTFTPDASQTCAVSQTMTITVNPVITPTFTQVDPICNGDDLGELPTESNNGVTGTWAPVIDNTETTTYTFSPDITQSGQACAVNETMTITVNPVITPTFTQVDPICSGDDLGELPTESNNGITGTWAPAIDNTATKTYTFTPDITQPDQACAINETMTITVNPVITPTFTQVDPICNEDDLDPLPLTSNDGITGTWAPVINNTATETYTFTPDASQTCAVSQTMTITVNPVITPTFTQVDPICNGDDLGELPTESNNGVTGTWAPVIDNTETTTYTFSPDITQSGQACAVNETMTITVNPVITPTFTQVDPICNGDDLGELPTESNNGITGTWAPAIDNTATKTYTFTPDITQPDQACAVNETMTITVNPVITPTFTQVDPICNGEFLATLPTISNNGITGTWSPAIDNTLTTTYTFAPDTTQPDQVCAVNQTMEITVKPLITPTFTQVDPICNGDDLSSITN